MQQYQRYFGGFRLNVNPRMPSDTNGRCDTFPTRNVHIYMLGSLYRRPLWPNERTKHVCIDMCHKLSTR